MRILLAIALFILILVPLIGNSYAYSIESELKKYNFLIYAQIEVRNSQDQLVSFLESKKIVVLDLSKLNSLLDQNTEGIEKSVITISGKQYEMIKGVATVIHSSPTVVSKSTISNRQENYAENLVYADHDGYPVITGDKVITTWTIIRPSH